MAENTKSTELTEEYTPANVNDSFLTGLANQSGKIEKLATALAKAQSELTGARSKSENPYFKSKYADLFEVLEATRPILSKHGLSIVQTTDRIEIIGETAFLNVGTMLMHTSGQWIRSFTPFPIEKPVNCHKLGSAFTYGRRYGLAAIVGIAQMDDDGNAAIEKPKPKRTTPQPVRPAPVRTSADTNSARTVETPQYTTEAPTIDGGTV